MKLSIAGITPIKLPLRPAAVGKLISAAEQAPYGQRTKTLVDKNVRDTLEIDGSHVGLSDDLQAVVHAAAAEAAGCLGLDKDRLRVDLYKLLIYPKGGFFKPHRDSEKSRGMVATMIVVLPNPFGGGELIVRHGGKETTVRFSDASTGRAMQYAAFFADCEHEVVRVRSGVRVCLAFNLILKPSTPSTGSTKTDGDPHVTRALRDWASHRPSDPLVLALEHQYTQSGLKPSLLKGADSKLHHMLAQAAADCDYAMHFGQVSRHLCQHADDGNYGYDRYRHSSPSVDYGNLNIGEVYEDEIVIDGWKDETGKPVGFPHLMCDVSQLISNIPVEDWIPTSQDYEGYTGNAGNTLDRWYHKSAMILWPRAQWLGIYLNMGIGFAIEQLLVMRQQLSDTPDEELEAACGECQRTAEAIIDRWPSRIHDDYGKDDPKAKALQAFAAELIQYDDPRLMERFLMMLHQKDHSLPLSAFIVAAGKRLGVDLVKPMLLEFLNTNRQPNQYGIVFGEGLVARDASWLASLFQRKDRGGFENRDLSELLGAALKQFKKNVEIAERDRWSRSGKPAPIWIDLCKAALSIDDTAAMATLFAIPAASPSTFDLRKICVPAAVELHQWSRKQSNQISPALSAWIDGVIHQLRTATMAEPQPPTDFARPVVTRCDCQLCTQLSAFLSDPALSTTRIAARQDRRDHLQQEIDSAQLDVATKLDRSGSPHALLMTKTTGSHDLAVEQCRADLKFLVSLESL